MPNVMAAQRNIGGALCNIPQFHSLYHAAKFGRRRLLECRAVTLPIQENARLRRKLNFAPYKIPSGGKSSQMCIYSVPQDEAAKHSAKFGWPPLTDVAAVTKARRKPVKISWDAQTPKPISAVCGPKFAMLLGHVEVIWLYKYLFPIDDTCLSCEDTARQICAMDR